MNRNAYKSALIFLGIILIALIANLFLTENELLVKEQNPTQTAGINCVEDSALC